MTDTSIDKIKTGALSRGLAVSLAGLKSGTRFAAGSLMNLGRGSERSQANRELLEKEAKAFVEELGKLKGAYVKIGQMLGLYAQHVLRPELSQALKSLNDQTLPLQWQAIQPVIEQQLGHRYAEFDIDPKPIAAASLAQVHRATHKDSGNSVVLKVQYPGVAESIDSDFNAVIRLMRVARWVQRDERTQSVLDEILSLVKQEVDYRYEMEVMQTFKQRLADDPRYHVPEVWQSYCSEKLLVMEYIQGETLDSAAFAALALAQRNQVGVALLELFFKEVYQWQSMQTDPNLGNYLLTIKAGQPVLNLLDFGAVRDFDSDFMNALALTIASAVERDQAQTIVGLDRMDFFSADQSQAAKASFATFCELLVEPFCAADKNTPSYAINADGEYRWAQSNLVKRAAKLGGKYAVTLDFTMPPKEFALITRKLSGLFGVIATLNLELNTRPVLAHYVATWRANQRL